MSRYIDAIKLIGKMMVSIRHGYHEEDMLDIVNEQPTVDAVPVVCCKNCIYRGKPMKCPLVTYTIKQNPNYTEKTTTNPYAEYKARTVVEMQDNTNDYDYCSKGVMRK